MIKWFFGEKAIAAILAIILMSIGLVSFVSHKNTMELIDSYHKVQKTYELLNTLTNFYAAMTVAESGRRGYIFSGNLKELERYKNARVLMRIDLNQLEHQIADSVESKKLSLKLKDLVEQRLSLLTQSIDIYQNNYSNLKAQSQITDASVLLREKIQDILWDIKQQEDKELNIYLQSSRERSDQLVLIEQLVIILSFFIIFVAFIIFHQKNLKAQKVIILQKQLEQERELSSFKNYFFSMISHEFRTPLSVIIASSQLLEEILLPLISQDKLKNIWRIQTSAKFINHLLTDILTLSRAEAGKLEFNPEFLDIEVFCLNLLEDIESFNVTKPKFNLSSIDYSNRVYADEKILYSVISNLLLNAIKYSPEDSKIDLEVKNVDQQTIFIIRDQGIGITLEEQEKIFEPFLRGKNVENVPGSGLGLAVVKRCLEMHGGTIHLDSEVGKGTTFTVAIPQNKMI